MQKMTRRGALKITAGFVVARAAWPALGQSTGGMKKRGVEYRKLGRTGLEVSLLGYGGLRAGTTEPQRLSRLLNTAIDRGLNLIDTAHCYPGSEAGIGAAIGHRRDDYYIVTKIGHENGEFGGDWTGSRESIFRTLEESCRRMKTDHVDVAMIHTCPTDWIARDRMIESLNAARDRGLTRFIGYSGDDNHPKAAMMEHDIDVIEITINPLDQGGIELLSLAQERDIGVLVKRSIANAIWRYEEAPGRLYIDEYWRRMRVMDFPFMKREALQDEDPDGPAGTMLRFAAGFEGVSSLIVGTKTPGRWESNLELLGAGPLDSEVVGQIRARWSKLATDEWVGQ